MPSPTTTDAIAFLPAADLEATSAFYSGKLGLRLAVDQGACRIFQAAERAFFGFCAHLPVLSNPESVILTLVTDDPEAWHRRCAEAGIETDGPPRFNEKFGILHFFASDPNGYRVEFQRFADPGWNRARDG